MAVSAFDGRSRDQQFRGVDQTGRRGLDQFFIDRGSNSEKRGFEP